jgi:hypothetical protein
VLPGLGEQVAEGGALPLDLRPGLQHPVLVHAGEQVTPVFGKGAGSVHQYSFGIVVRGGGDGGRPLTVEDAHVDATARGVLPAQILRGHHERRIVPEHLTQVVQLAAQVGERLRITGLRPEQARDAVSGLR